MKFCTIEQLRYKSNVYHESPCYIQIRIIFSYYFLNCLQKAFKQNNGLYKQSFVQKTFSILRNSSIFIFFGFIIYYLVFPPHGYALHDKFTLYVGKTFIFCEFISVRNTILISNDIILFSSILLRNLNIYSLYKISRKSN